MKRLFFFILALILLFSLPSCQKDGSEGGEMSFQPLFQFRIPEGRGDEIRILSCPASRGFFYLHPTDGGFVGGFVSPERSVSAESVLQGEGKVLSPALFEKKEDLAFVLAGDRLYTALFSGSAQSTALPDGFDPESALFYDALSVMSVKGDLILMHPVDFSETYVLAKNTLLPDFHRLLGVSHNGKRIWYSKGEEGNFQGIGFFEYGSNLPLGEEKFSFDSVQAVGQSALLFTRSLNGDTLYTYRDLNSDTVRTLTVDQPFDGVTVTRDGKTLAGIRKTQEGGTVEIYDLTRKALLASHPIADQTPSPALALSEDGKTLLFSLSREDRQTLATLSGWDVK